MLSQNLKIKILIVLSIVSWLLFTSSSWMYIFSQVNHVEHGFSNHFPKFFYVIFFLTIYLFFKISLRPGDQINMSDLLWRVFATGLIATAISLSLQVMVYSLSENKFIDNKYFNSLIFTINTGVLTTFVISTFVVWEKLIFYQKTKMLIYSWRAFVYFIIASLMISFFKIDIISSGYQYLTGFIVIISIIFSFNLKWVAYLSSRHKLRSILLIALVIAYLGYFIYVFLQYYRNDFLNIYLSDVTLLVISGFVIIYAFIAFLVLLFNLPTSPVFEKKLEEIVNFQRLSQTYNTGRNADEIPGILLDSSISAVLADAAWLEINYSGSPDKKCLTFHLDAFQVHEIKNKIIKGKMHKIPGSPLIKHIKQEQVFTGFRYKKFKSILVFPIFIKDEEVGMLVLLKEISDGFNPEMTGIIRTFIEQASISIENYRLFETVIENERYKKELNIARTIQKNLLPESMGQTAQFDIAAYSMSADEVGGDYYDIFYKKDKVIIIIADVSSKGISAVFHMSQLKGIFQSLVQLDLPSDKFMTLANNALSKGLDKSSFVTVSYFVIGAESRQIEFSRAGHCPFLLYSQRTKRADYFYGEGIGLAIMRNQEFNSHVNIHRIEFEAGDVLLMFTDGIIEAKNYKREEFGYERLQNLLISNASHQPEEIRASIISDLYHFCDSKDPDDDYSLVILKFK
jgi:sigma-B regulation protein RsbU (phosphoserine phosphatase)